MNAQVQYELRAIPLNQLHISPRNVRKTGGKRIETLAASIKARGLIHRLTVIPRPREAGQPGFDVVVGKRRTAALRLLAKHKALAQDAPVDCRIVPPEQATATSLAENVEREKMHPADEFAAFAKLVDEGTPAEDIAAEFGVSVDTVHKRLRLANVSPRVMKLYRADELTLEQVMAFAFTDDHAAQDALLEDGARPSAWQIRRALTETAVPANDPRARCIGRDAYVAAGGSIRRDLFDDDATEYFEDVALLERLVAEKLEKAAGRLRKRLPWVQTVAGTLDYETRSQFGRIPTVRQEPDSKTAKKLERLQAQLAEAQAQVAALDEQGGDDDEADQAWQQANERCEAIEDKIAEIERGLVTPDPDAAALAGAVVALDHRGKVEVTDGLIRPEDKREAAKAVKAKQPAVAKDTGEAGDSRAVRRELSVFLTAVAQQALANNVPLALRALAFQMVLALRGRYRGGHGVGIDADDHADVGDSETLVGSDAEAKRAKWHAAWERTLPTDRDALWTWCCESDDHMIVSLLAYCTARSFNATQDRDAAQPAMPLLSALKLDMTDHWKPNAGYFKRLRKSDTLAILGKFGHGGPAFAKLKRDVLAESAGNLLAKTGWLPPTLTIPAE
ncbi:ParB/RepB/Spo0J family partition protein [Luteimonas marina]|uniref:ParB/RepB/Spo0J family partition protein n=1 Tax=Luteimonas marina TaxID=488485 RepID=A0A5C5U1S7_9GAMM|nr:ParB/RepB/Spo0J family partition protein [Luteimonas marina]TWT20321.1 ParB/RepB/Spo0J family partition protein [Luteimonas marina]